MKITHQEQKEKWEREHAHPFALKQIDVQKPSNSLELFSIFLKKLRLENLVGLEMGCGKGRNAIWLAQQSHVAKVYGFDFSEHAIAEAKQRAAKAGMSDKTQFDVMDATERWDYDSDSFDFGVDCTASTDIEDPVGRQNAVHEMHRVLKPSGYFLVYVMSTDDEYHKMMIGKSPAEEKNAFYHPDTGKFEKVFSEEELDTMYAQFRLAESRRIEKMTEFFGKEYFCKLHWRVYQK